MVKMQNSILIIDEYGFSKICSAILQRVGYETNTASLAGGLPSTLNDDAVGLIVTSYPYGVSLFDEIKKRNIPTIILSDSIDEKLIDILGNFGNSFCMIKPIDYDKFKFTVKQAVERSLQFEKGYSIV